MKSVFQILPGQMEVQSPFWTLEVGAGAPAVEWRRVRAQSCPLPSPAAAGVRLTGAGAFRPR